MIIIGSLFLQKINTRIAVDDFMRLAWMTRIRYGLSQLGGDLSGYLPPFSMILSILPSRSNADGLSLLF